MKKMSMQSIPVGKNSILTDSKRKMDTAVMHQRNNTTTAAQFDGLVSGKQNGLGSIHNSDQHPNNNSQLLKSVNMANNINLVNSNNNLQMNASMDNLIGQNQSMNPKSQIYFAQNTGNSKGNNTNQYLMQPNKSATKHHRSNSKIPNERSQFNSSLVNNNNIMQHSNIPPRSKSNGRSQKYISKNMNANFKSNIYENQTSREAFSKVQQSDSQLAGSRHNSEINKIISIYQNHSN